MGIYFWWVKLDFAEALKYCQRALSLAESAGHSTLVGYNALASMCSILIVTGKPLRALENANVAYICAENIGDIYGQAYSLHLQAICQEIMANYWHAQLLLEKCRDILAACGQQQSSLELTILNLQAEIHLKKSEYLESRKLQVVIASRCQPTSYDAILAKLNIAFIDITTGADSKVIQQNLDMAQSQLKALYGILQLLSSVFEMGLLGLQMQCLNCFLHHLRISPLIWHSYASKGLEIFLLA
jgi:hypothetical protein